MDLKVYDELYTLEDRHWWFVARRAIILALLRAHSPHPNGNRILDIGCGTGCMLVHLQSLGEVTGVDPEEAAIRYCRERGLTSVVQGAFPASLPFAPASFDIITALDVLEHVADDAGALRAIADLLQPGGIALVTVPAFRWMWSEHDDVAHHLRRYTRSELKHVIAQTELQTLKLSYFNSWLFPLIAAYRLLSRRHSASPSSDLAMPSPGVNALLTALFASERHLLPHLNLPYGVSLLALLRKEE